MAEALLGTVIQNLQSFGKDQLATFWGVDQQTQKLSSNLTAIRAVLRDAERKQITSHAVKDWLQKLTDAAYVLDDILDECSIHSTKLNFDDRHTSCLSRLHPKDILFRFNIGKRMKDITQRFHDIHEERSMFNLVPGVTEVQTIHDNWRQTSSDITEPIVYGRDQDREQILKFLLEDVSDSEELSIYPIVGMGGLGKTTLAKQVFNDNRVCKHFDLTIWVCVSDDFNTMTILQSIIECITGQNPNLNSLEAMRKKVEEVLHGSRKRMKNINQRFHDINEERRMFELRDGVTEKPTVDDGEDDQTTSVITEPIFCGRDEDREKVVKVLLEANNNEDLTIYPIFGMVGLGKTTLAKHVFHDHRICKHFDLTIWVYVSVDFNVKAILQSIIEYATGQNPNLHSLETMRKKVEEVLQSKRYLLVLDDVWNEDQEKWKHLEGMLRFARGAKGATVLVTTRLEEVASIMQTHIAYHLKELSEHDSWSLFKSYAFGPNREEKEELVAIGEDIVKKCVGSPLAIKTQGSLLRDQTALTQWENIKESEIWDIRSESSSMTGKENSIMRALKLSYFNLELSFWRCFSFCAIFPKGFEIVKEELIHLWMANGFIKSEGNVEVEDVANNVWRKLYRRFEYQQLSTAVVLPAI